jgi:Helix-turn-helix domain
VLGWTGRPKGGRHGEDVRDRFWDALRSGACVAAGARAAGVSRTTGGAWLAEAGGMVPKLSREEPESRLRFVDRCRIEELLKAGHASARIAVLLGRHRCTISRELARGGGPQQYRAVAAQGVAEQARLRPKERKLETNPRLLAAVVAGFKRRHSPEQIAGRLRRDHPNDPEMWVSHETIYQALYVQPRGELAREIRATIKAGKALRSGREHRLNQGPAGLGAWPDRGHDQHLRTARRSRRPSRSRPLGPDHRCEQPLSDRHHGGTDRRVRDASPPARRPHRRNRGRRAQHHHHHPAPSAAQVADLMGVTGPRA